MASFVPCSREFQPAQSNEPNCWPTSIEFSRAATSQHLQTGPGDTAATDCFSMTEAVCHFRGTLPARSTMSLHRISQHCCNHMLLRKRTTTDQFSIDLASDFQAQKAPFEAAGSCLVLLPRYNETSLECASINNEVKNCRSIRHTCEMTESERCSDSSCAFT
jgi:hypothetical protein